MPRIRSIHPGIWTDEAFMGLTVEARLLFIGLWNEAFDDGVFEWKPLQLKARLFPADNVEIDKLLALLLEADMIARIATHPKQPGMIRNFRKFQRPKKPNSSGMLPHEWFDYVGLAAPISGTMSDQFPIGGEQSPLMEEEGGRRNSSEPEGSGATAPIIEDLEVRLFRRGKEVLGKSAGGVIQKLRKQCRGNLAETLKLIEQAAKKEAPMEWVQGILRTPDPEAAAYRNLV